ncbi:MAG: SDR family oxidoreductase [Thermoguttaceae bacterium]|nr:SDR family oxidoreductase [Thermoguttaceae bacterium]
MNLSYLRKHAKKIIVAGGAGFLGSHLCEYLVRRGDDVLCVDNFSTCQRSNIDFLLPCSNFRVLEHDITDPFFESADEIYNLACPASPIHYQHDPIKTLKTSVLGSLNLLELAKQCSARILQASTSEVYGNPTVHPQPESYLGTVNTIGPRSCYDEGKRAAETAFMDYHRTYGLEIRIARIFNTYGPRMHPYDGRVISNFIIQSFQNRPITIFGGGSQTRSFCYCTDLIEGLVRLMENPQRFTGPVNLGNPEEITILELGKVVQRCLGKKNNFNFQPLPQDDPCRRRPDITLAQEILNWKPTISLETGLQSTIEWFRSINLNDFQSPTPNYSL